VGTSGVAGITVFLNQKLYETVPLSKIQEENGEGELWGNKDPTVLLL